MSKQQKKNEKKLFKNDEISQLLLQEKYDRINIKHTYKSKTKKLFKKREVSELLSQESFDRHNILHNYENGIKILYFRKKMVSYYVRNLSDGFLMYWIPQIDLIYLDSDVVNTLALLTILENKLSIDLLNIIDSFTHRRIKEKKCEKKYMKLLDLYKNVNQYDKRLIYENYLNIELNKLMEKCLNKLFGYTRGYNIINVNLLSEVVIDNTLSFGMLNYVISRKYYRNIKNPYLYIGSYYSM
jgi:hypothetical protein